jgi:hypothetical protein
MPRPQIINTPDIHSRFTKKMVPVCEKMNLSLKSEASVAKKSKFGCNIKFNDQELSIVSEKNLDAVKDLITQTTTQNIGGWGVDGLNRLGSFVPGDHRLFEKLRGKTSRQILEIIIATTPMPKSEHVTVEFLENMLTCQVKSTLFMSADKNPKMYYAPHFTGYVTRLPPTKNNRAEFETHFWGDGQTWITCEGLVQTCFDYVSQLKIFN